MLRKALSCGLLLLLVFSVAAQGEEQAQVPAHSHHEEFQTLNAKLEQIQSSTEQKLSELRDSLQSSTSERLSSLESSLSAKVTDVQRASAERLSQLESSVSQKPDSSAEVRQFAEKLAALEASVKAQNEANEKLQAQLDGATKAMSELSASVKKSSSSAASAASASAEADSRMSKMEKELASLKELVAQVQSMSTELQSSLKSATAKMDLQYNATLLMIKEGAGSGNITDFAKFIDSMSKRACAFYEEHVAPSARTIWAHTQVYTAHAVKVAKEWSVFLMERGQHHGREAHAAGMVHLQQAHGLAKQKLVELGVPAEHGDNATYGVFGLVSLLVVSILLLVLRCMCSCCCGSKRSREAAGKLDSSSKPDAGAATTGAGGPRKPASRK